MCAIFLFSLWYLTSRRQGEEIKALEEHFGKYKSHRDSQLETISKINKKNRQLQADAEAERVALAKQKASEPEAVAAETAVNVFKRRQFRPAAEADAAAASAAKPAAAATTPVAAAAAPQAATETPSAASKQADSKDKSALDLFSVHASLDLDIDLGDLASSAPIPVAPVAPTAAFRPTVPQAKRTLDLGAYKRAKGLL